MGRHQYAKDYKVTVGHQGQRKTYYDHDSREGDGRESSGPPQRGNNKVWRRGDRRVSFNDRGRGGGVAKRSGGRGGGRPRFDTSRAAALLENDQDMRGGPSIQAGRARPASRSLRSKYRGLRTGRGGISDRNRFVSLAPLSSDNVTKIQEAMNKRYNPATKALDLENFGADSTFGGSSAATGKLSDDRVMQCVVDTIGQHLSDLEAINVSNNHLRSLKTFSKLVDKAPRIKILYMEHNKLGHSKELDNISKLTLLDLKLDGNPFIGNFKDGTHYSSTIQRKFKSLQMLDGKELQKLILFEDDDAAPGGSRSLQSLPSQPKMVVNDQVGDFIGKFLEQYFSVYDSDSREPLAMAYHEEAMMSMSAQFPRVSQDNTTKEYVQDSRNLQLDFIRENAPRRDRLLHRKRLQIVGFLDKLPRTQHDLTSFTLDVPFATDRLVTFAVTGIFRERAEKPPCPIRQFSRMFVVIPQGEGLCIVNDSLCITGATREQTERSTSIFTLAERTGMNVTWSKICLEGQSWNLEQATQAFAKATAEGKIPAEAFTK